MSLIRVLYVLSPDWPAVRALFICRQFGTYDYSQGQNYPAQSYYPPQQSAFSGTILTPGNTGANLRGVPAQFGDVDDDFENEPPLLEGEGSSKIR